MRSHDDASCFIFLSLVTMRSKSRCHDARCHLLCEENRRQETGEASSALSLSLAVVTICCQCCQCWPYGGDRSPHNCVSPLWSAFPHTTQHNSRPGSPPLLIVSSKQISVYKSVIWGILSSGFLEIFFRHWLCFNDEIMDEQLLINMQLLSSTQHFS